MSGNKDTSQEESVKAGQEEVQFIAEKKNDQLPGRRNSVSGQKKRPRESDQMPNTARSPQKRTCKNSIGGTPQPSPKPQSSKQDAPSTSAVPPPAGMDPATREFLEAMEKNIVGSIAEINAKVKTNTDSINGLKESQENMKRDIDKEFERQKKENRMELDRAIEEIKAVPNTTTLKLTRQQEESYDFHRRSLRMWPIKGPNYAANIRTFLVDRLKFAADFLVDMGNVEVKKFYDIKQAAPKVNTRGAAAAAAGRPVSPQDEIIATFRTRECRDRVKAAGVHLAGQTEAGIRIHVPGFMLDQFHALQSVGFHMKKKDENVRRSIKFDDVNQSLVMDIKIDGVWKRITSEEAKAAAEQNPDIQAGPTTMGSADIAAFLSKK